PGPPCRHSSGTPGPLPWIAYQTTPPGTSMRPSVVTLLISVVSAWCQGRRGGQLASVRVRVASGRFIRQRTAQITPMAAQASENQTMLLTVLNGSPSSETKND